MPTLELDPQQLRTKLEENGRAIQAATARRQEQQRAAARARRALREARRALRRAGF